jgi:DNA-directed RNA polymerase
MIYLNKCKAEGINSVMCVHDCYATHATDTETSARLLREAFTEIYSQPILENFISDIKKSLLDEELDLPELPQFGDLEIEDVKSSRYFFN